MWLLAEDVYCFARPLTVNCKVRSAWILRVFPRLPGKYPLRNDFMDAAKIYNGVWKGLCKHDSHHVYYRQLRGCRKAVRSVCLSSDGVHLTLLQHTGS